MKRASITQAKNSLNKLIDGVKAGTPVLIVNRGHPVARLEPVTGAGSLTRCWKSNRGAFPAVFAGSRRARRAVGDGDRRS